MMKAYLRKLFVVMLALGMVQSLAAVGHAQVMPNMMPNMMMNNMMMFNNFFGAGGVIVDADGVLRTQMTPDPNGQLSRQRIAAARSALDPKLAKKSPLRKISLNRLEAAVKSRTDMGMKPTEDMANMAGMTRIQYVFFYPETNDIVLAGPAEAYGADIAGRVRGLDSGNATLNLDDLVVSLRAFFGEKGREAPLVSVSIDPTKEGLQQMQQFLVKTGSRATPNDTEFIVKGLKESLGLQTVRLTGIPASSHFAQVLVEADYRMKLIGIGLEPPPANVKMASWAARANPTAISRNALQRWYFVPDYQCVRVAEDELAMELVGDGVKLVSADELVNADGTRAKNGTVDLASKGFTSDFTKNYAGIAKGIPVYWQLRNGIDMLVAAAFIKEHKYADKAGWKMETFLNEKEYAVETLNVPKQVETAVAAFWKGNRLATPIGGGVHIEPAEALKSNNLLDDKGGKVKAKRDEINLNALAKDQWWWD